MITNQFTPKSHLDYIESRLNGQNQNSIKNLLICSMWLSFVYQFLKTSEGELRFHFFVSLPSVEISVLGGEYNWKTLKNPQKMIGNETTKKHISIELNLI